MVSFSVNAKNIKDKRQRYYAPLPKWILCAFVFVIGLNISVSVMYKTTFVEWVNVPPVPTRAGALAMTLDDEQLAYRALGVHLQNMGDTGGRSTSLDQYDYKALTDWFMLLDSLDARSSYAPHMAAFYYGSVSDGKKLPPLLSYLTQVGEREGAQRWRWLAHAVYLARYSAKDLDLALKLAQKLANTKDSDAPLWTKKMPAFIAHAKGDKKEALAIMIEILKSSAGDKNIDPAEVYTSREYICTRILEEDEAKTYEFCKDFL